MFKSILSVFIFVCLTQTAWADQDTLHSIEQLRWENRIVVTQASEPTWNALYDAFARHGVSDRRIIWFRPKQSNWVSNINKPLSKSLIQELEKFSESAVDASVILVGLDGGLKHHYTELSWQMIFDDIDRMPMRQEELIRRGY